MERQEKIVNAFKRLKIFSACGKINKTNLCELFMNRIEYKKENIFSYVEYSPLQKREKMPSIIQLHGGMR